jgi:hypothetical protein
VYHVGHRGPDCTENEVPPLEFKWRMIAASIKKGVMAAVAHHDFLASQGKPESGMAISVEHDVPLMAPNVLNEGDSGVPECADAAAEAPFGDVTLLHTECTPGSHKGSFISWSFI